MTGTFSVGDKVETIYGFGVVEWITDYSEERRYYDVRLDDGGLVKITVEEMQIA